MTRQIAKGIARLAIASLVLGLIATILSIQPIADELPPVRKDDLRAEFVDRSGRVLATSYQNQFNYAQQIPLSAMPTTLVRAFVQSEDQRFYQHRGVDWLARGHAVWQAIRYGRTVRGASSITEQAVRILHSRPRTIWTRWLEGFEARLLEERYAKQEILEFYLNQIPFGGRRRGLAAAAHYYFDRDLSTLNLREQLALVVLVRAPERFDPRRSRTRLDKRIDWLIERLERNGSFDGEQSKWARASTLEVSSERSPVEAAHFVRYLREHEEELVDAQGIVRTTIDGTLQTQIQGALTHLLARFSANEISHGAALVIDHEKGEILAWVNDRQFNGSAVGSQIDAVVSRRQPGSTLKPFVYAEALERGWTAATILEDNQLLRQVGAGLHRYRNYSRTYHGDVRLREALGSSLNIPAIRAAEFIGRSDLLETLREFGFDSLRRGADHYGEGLALGNGEVSLRELVSAYSVLARGGERLALRGVISGTDSPLRRSRVISPESASIIADILADPDARLLEFGRGGVLQFPTQTAIKTGTSGGYRDLWAVGFSARFTAGVWMGNLDRRPTRGLTSSQAPAILLRSIFALLEQRWDGAKLPMRGDLVTRTICAETGETVTLYEEVGCRKIDEIFSRLTPEKAAPATGEQSPEILVPSPGLVIARDPRIPDQFEKLGLRLTDYRNVHSVRWYVDERFVGEGVDERQPVGWGLESGAHQVSAEVTLLRAGARTRLAMRPVSFIVR